MAWLKKLLKQTGLILLAAGLVYLVLWAKVKLLSNMKEPEVRTDQVGEPGQ